MKTKFILFFAFVLNFNTVVFSQQSAHASLSLDIRGVVNDACNSSTGSMKAYVFGGVWPYTYQWSNGETTQSIDSLPVGIYTCTVTDGALTVVTAQDTIVNGGIKFFTTTVNPIVGISNPDGLITIDSFLNGVGPFSVSWFDGGTGSTRTVNNSIYLLPPNCSYLTDGTTGYGFKCPVVVMDNNGCSGGDSIEVKHFGSEFIGIYATPGCPGYSGGGIEFIIYGESVYSGDWGTSWQWNKAYDFKAVLLDSVSNPIDSTAGIDNPPSPWSRNFIFENLEPGIYSCLLYLNNGISFHPVSNFGIQVEVPSLPTPCGNVNGNIFADIQRDCYHAGNEPSIPNSTVTIQPGNIYKTADVSGNYSVNLAFGNYSISHFNSYPGIAPNCPVQPYNFTLDNVTPQRVINFADTADNVTDLSAIITSGAVRPGFNTNASVLVRNNRFVTAYNNNLTVAYDTTLQLLSTNPVAASSTPGVIQWNIDSITGLQDKNYFMEFQTPADTSLIGDLWAATANITTGSVENYLDNNLDSVAVTITGSADPNDKSVMPSGITNDHLISAEADYLKYTIRFQNTGTDTAFNVVVVDTITPQFLLNTFINGPSSHNYRYEIDSLPVVKFYFDNILLPDSNTNEEASHGYVSFLIKREPSLTNNAVISNAASIYFDFNPAVITNTAFVQLYDCENLSEIILSDDSVCVGDSVILLQQPQLPLNSLEWFIDGNSYSSNDTVLFAVNQQGIYNVELVAANEICAVSFSKQILADSATAAISLNGLAVICGGNPVTLSANNGTAYLWNNGATTQTISVSNSGIYTVTVTNNFCSAISAPVGIVNVPLPPQPSITSWTGNSILCNLTGYSYQWYLNGVLLPDDTLQSLAVTVNGIYTVNITDSNGCTATSTGYSIAVGISENSPPNIVVNTVFNSFIIIRGTHIEGTIVLCDVSGKEILRQQTVEGETQLNVPGLAKGFYFLHYKYKTTDTAVKALKF